MSTRLLLPLFGVLIWSMSEAGELAERSTHASLEIPAKPLRPTGIGAPISAGGYFAWSGQAVCDDDENASFLVVPELSPSSLQGGTVATAEVSGPRDVLRVSADGKKRLTFSPASVSKFANAKEIRTLTVALDPDGGLFMLVWVRWAEMSEQHEKSGQYIVSFDKKGEYRSHQEVDWKEILIQQFEVFGSGQFLVRGRRPDRPEPRLAILSAGAQELHDVTSWPGLYEALEEPSNTSTGITKFDQIVRGGDGRIYLAQRDARKGDDVVYAFRPSGDIEEAFTLRRMRRSLQLLSLKAAGNWFAATYLAAEHQSGASPGEQRGVWWIAVYGNVASGGDVQPTVYGPAPGPPICYRHEESGDRFTFLKEGKLVTMASP